MNQRQVTEVSDDVVLHTDMISDRFASRIYRKNCGLFKKEDVAALWPNICSLSDYPLCEGIPVLQPSRFYPCPSALEKFKAVRGLDAWKLCLALWLQNVCFILVKKFATFLYVNGVFAHRNLSLF